MVEILFLGHTSDVRILLKVFPDAWFLYSAIVVAFVSSWQARIAAAQWGEWVKAAFDVFLPELCTKLGYKRPLDIKAEREFWTKVSQAIVYRDPVSLEELTDLREAASDRTSKKGSNYDKQVTEKDSSKRRGFGDNLVRVARLLTWSLIFRRQIVLQGQWPREQWIFPFVTGHPQSHAMYYLGFLPLFLGGSTYAPHVVQT